MYLKFALYVKKLLCEITYMMIKEVGSTVKESISHVLYSFLNIYIYFFKELVKGGGRKNPTPDPSLPKCPKHPEPGWSGARSFSTSLTWLQMPKHLIVIHWFLNCIKRDHNLK